MTIHPSKKPQTPPPPLCGDLEMLRGCRTLVVGLGRFGGGVGVTRWLVEQGARVTVTDQGPAETLAESVQELADLDVSLHLDGHDPAELDEIDLVVVNPAVHKAHCAFFQEIVRRNIAWTTQTNLFCERCPATVIGVTGSFGKSTTCAMLAAALRHGRDTEPQTVDYDRVFLGGNIGGCLLSSLASMKSRDLVVLEMSSAQLEDLPRINWVPHIAVWTNLFPHHEDRYDSFESYLGAKLNILRASDYRSRVFLGDLQGNMETLIGTFAPGILAKSIRVALPDPAVELRLPGDHNQANAGCVLAVCEHFGLQECQVRDALRQFRGLPHRLELVRSLGGVDFVNDSKSTSPATTIHALRSFARPIVLLVGGQPPDASLDGWAAIAVRSCRCVICFGESALAFRAAIRAFTAQSDSILPTHEIEELAEAVKFSRDQAQPGDVVLFSPGARSFDRYRNYADRGRHFVRLVESLSH